LPAFGGGRRSDAMVVARDVTRNARRLHPPELSGTAERVRRVCPILKIKRTAFLVSENAVLVPRPHVRQGNGALGFLVVAEAVGDRFGSCI
jgi:hypothetical protein